MKCISVRQPWASFIFADHPLWKDIENREWPTKFRGWTMIHAAKSCTKEEYAEAVKFALKVGMTQIIPYDRLKRGGVIGIVRVVDCVMRDRSKWFTGKFGHRLDRPYPLPFMPSAGQLGYYEFGSFKSAKKGHK